MKRWTNFILGFAMLAVASSVPGVAGAQGRGQPMVPVPKNLRPPPGMCRVWLDNVPAKLQPAPTDCATAMRNRPTGARVIFGDTVKAQSEEPKGKGKGNERGKGKAKKP